MEQNLEKSIDKKEQLTNEIIKLQMIIEEKNNIIEDFINTSKEAMKEWGETNIMLSNVIDESQLFNQTLIEVAYRLRKRIILHAWMGGTTIESLIKEIGEIFTFIEEKYNELPYSNNGDYFHDMLDKLTKDKNKKIKK